MDAPRRPLRILAVADRPRPRLLGSGGEEGDQVERGVGGETDSIERGLVDPELGQEGVALLGGQLRHLGLHLGVDRDQRLPALGGRPGKPGDVVGIPALVDVRDQDLGLRGQEVERLRQRLGESPRRPAGVQPRRKPLQERLLRDGVAVARLGSLGDPLGAPLDGRLVGQHQLQLDRLQVVHRIDPATRMGDGGVVEAAEHVQHRVGRPDRAQELVSQPLAMGRAANQAGDVDHLQGRRHDPRRRRDPRQLGQSWVAYGRLPGLALDGREHVRRHHRRVAGERHEDTRFAAVREPHQTGLEPRHQSAPAIVPTAAPTAAPAATSDGWWAPT